MSLRRLLVANRGEIAVRICRAAAELGIPTLAIFSEDDAESLHTRKADEARPLAGRGPAAYLDIAQIVAVAREAGCDAVHPGYGFLAENAQFARRCEEAGLTFVGPTADTLWLFGDKLQARALAQRAGVPVLDGSAEAVTAADVHAFFKAHEDRPVAIKAVGGGGGRGMRIVGADEEIDEAWERCRSEAQSAFGNPSLYVEQAIPRARHIEVQILGDGSGAVVHLGERECSLQRRHQKIVEVAPSPGLAPGLRDRLTEAAVRMASEASYRSLGTFEFLVDASQEDDDAAFAFMETNARLQVEHTVTEAVTGVDLVQAQLRVAGGASLAALGLEQDAIPVPRGYAVQARVNMETMSADGTARPAGGTLAAFEPASGPGVRTDTFGYAGYRASPSFDSLLAKVIGHTPSPDYAEALRRTARALAEFRVEGVPTNISFLQALLAHPDVASNDVYTRFVDDQMTELVDAAAAEQPRFYFQSAASQELENTRRLAGVKVDSRDPLAVLAHGKGSTERRGAEQQRAVVEGPDGTVALTAPIQGTIVSLAVAEGDAIRKGQAICVMSAMKMEHVIRAERSGIVRWLAVEAGEAVFEGAALFYIAETEVEGADDEVTQAIDPDFIRPDLQQVIERRLATLDENRPQAVERRRCTGQRTARENVYDLCDDDSFEEHGQLVLTPGTGLPIDEVVARFPTDGMITGIGTVNGDLFGENARAVVMSYDYTVLAGTQGAINHPKTDRMVELAGKWRLPVVFFAEGGGGRAGTGGRRPGGRSTDDGRDSGVYRPLDTPTFATMARLSGLVPLVGITSGRCFAGNASLLGCCDVIIATEGSNLGMGGPALVEGGNLGVFTPEEIGPMEVQVPNGTIDIAVKDEAEAVQVAKRYLSYFQGPIANWECADQRRLRHVIPENRLRIYDIREVIETLADSGSFLEIRREFGIGMVTGFFRIEGRPMGLIANNPAYLAGAIDSDGSDKAARFMQLCDAFDVPLLVLCDTPGMMVGPEIEKTALVRHCSRLFVTGANLTIPHFTVVLRKAYGLGAQAMAGGSFKEPFFAVSWPTGEFGGMGLEGQVKLGYRNELEAIEDTEERAKRYEELVARAYERGKGLNAGVSFQVDDVIDPADTRRWLANGLRSAPPPLPRAEKKRRNIDTW